MGTSIPLTCPRMSVEEYLHSAFEPDADFVDGVIEERALGEFDHASWQDVLQAWFRNHAAEWNLRARPEYRVKVANNRYRVPDVTVLDRALPVEQILTTPPVAVFEILSPEDRMPRALRKLGDYEAMGVPNIFVIDTEMPRLYVFRNGSLELCTANRVQLMSCTAFLDWKALGELLY